LCLLADLWAPWWSACQMHWAIHGFVASTTGAPWCLYCCRRQLAGWFRMSAMSVRSPCLRLVLMSLARPNLRTNALSLSMHLPSLLLVWCLVATFECFHFFCFSGGLVSCSCWGLLLCVAAGGSMVSSLMGLFVGFCCVWCGMVGEPSVTSYVSHDFVMAGLLKAV